MKKKTSEVLIWNIWIWWKNPIRIQSMTNTKTSNVLDTFNQIKELFLAGSELVRITVDTEQSAEKVEELILKLRKEKIFIPIVWDFHFNWHILLEKFPKMAKSLDKYRINPWNTWKNEKNFEKIIKIAIKNDKPVRIWVNSWSLDKEILNKNVENFWWKKDYEEIFIDSMVQSALLSAKQAEEFWLSKNKIILSCKVSDVNSMILAYEKLSAKCDYPLHLWLTEAGSSEKWIISSTSALSILFHQWIWDTFRVSLTPKIWEKRSKEVEVCKLILQVLNIKAFKPTIVSCPWCWRTSSNKFQDLSEKVAQKIDEKLPEWKKKYKNFENLKVAVMGCIVNWPWESENCDIWISFPWDFEKVKMPVYLKWKFFKNLEWKGVFDDFMEIFDDFLEKNYKK